MNTPMDVGMFDPGTGAPNQSAGGSTKISKSDASGPSYAGTSGYGFMTNDPSMKIQGMAPSGDNSSGIPAAQPITPMMLGDPNNTAVDMDEASSRG